MGPQRGGPSDETSGDAYKTATGRDAKQDHPEWYPRPAPCSKRAFPLSSRWVRRRTRSKAVEPPSRLSLEVRARRSCPVRMVAIFDPTGKGRIEAGSKQRDGLTRLQPRSHLQAVMPEWLPRPCQHRCGQVPRARRRPAAAVGGHHAPLHPNGCSSARDREHSTINDYPVWRMFGTGVVVDAPKASGASSRPRIWRTPLPRSKGATWS
jgi:hypothetical protein